MGNAQRLLGSILEILKGYWVAAEKCPSIPCQPIEEKAELPSGCWQNPCNFRSHSLKRCNSVYIHKKSKMHENIFKTLSGSSPNYFLSQHTTFSQSQTDAKVRLNY
jgi:hypothetical protein